MSDVKFDVLEDVGLCSLSSDNAEQVWKFVGDMYLIIHRPLLKDVLN